MKALANGVSFIAIPQPWATLRARIAARLGTRSRATASLAVAAAMTREHPAQPHGLSPSPVTNPASAGGPTGRLSPLVVDGPYIDLPEACLAPRRLQLGSC